MTPGWYPDPSGRFPQRYYDGQAWTEQVVGANGMATTDIGTDASTLPAPTGPASISTPIAIPPSPASTTGTSEVTREPAHRLSWTGIAVAVLGTALTALSVTALSWASGTSFSDLREVSDTLSSSSYDDAVVAHHYGSWAWVLLLLVVAAGVVLVAAAINRRDGTGLRLVVAAVAATGALAHAGYVAQMFEGPGPAPGIGAWAGSLGYLITIVGLAIATPRRRSPA